jgi:hypothetical protein
VDLALLSVDLALLSVDLALLSVELALLCSARKVAAASASHAPRETTCRRVLVPPSKVLSVDAQKSRDA